MPVLGYMGISCYQSSVFWTTRSYFPTHTQCAQDTPSPEIPLPVILEAPRVAGCEKASLFSLWVNKDKILGCVQQWVWVPTPGVCESVCF